MIVGFKNRGTSDLFNGENSRAASKILDSRLHKTARRKLAMVEAATVLDDLRFPPGNELEALVRDRAGQHSIRINDQYRVCFVWTERGPDEVEVVDYH
jgi:proteic killer suppression protein